MSGLRAFFSRFSGGRRPPTGPLTISEQDDADKLGQETLEEDHRVERERREEGSSAGKDD